MFLKLFRPHEATWKGLLVCPVVLCDLFGYERNKVFFFIWYHNNRLHMTDESKQNINKKIKLNNANKVDVKIPS